jgi:excisionase family DNA binding protein
MRQSKVLTVKQTALRLGVTLKYVRDLLYEQKLSGARKQGRIWLIPASSVEQWSQTREGRCDATPSIQR